MASVRELTLKLVAQTDDMQKGIKGVDDKLGGLTGGLKKVGGMMAGAFAVAGIAEAGQAVVAFGKDSITEATNIAESVSKIGAVFGDSAKEAEKFARSANKSMGLADEEATAYMGTLGAMFTGLGKTQEESVGLSKSTMSLAADLGSFNNVSTPETLDMMSAAFRGEYDSIQRMLPGLNAAAVETEALQQTGKQNAKELTQQEKAMATLSLMYKQAGPAVGDFARTSDGAANKQKILTAQMEDMKAMIGEKLLPIWNAFLSFILNQLIPGIQWLATWIKDKAVPWIIEAWDKMWVYVGPIFELFKGMVWGLYQVLENLIGFIINVFTGDWKGAWDSIKKIFAGAWQYVSNVFSFYWHIIQAIWDGVLAGLKWVGGFIWDVISWPFRKGWELISWYINVIRSGIETVWNGIKGWLGSTGQAIYDAITWPFKAAWDFIKSTWNNTLGKISFTVPGWIPGIGGNKFEMPKLAKGGIISSPTVALLGEAGPEAVIPLSRLKGGSGSITINVTAGVGDPVEIGRKVASVLKAYERVSGPRPSGAI